MLLAFCEVWIVCGSAARSGWGSSLTRTVVAALEVDEVAVSLGVVGVLAFVASSAAASLASYSSFSYPRIRLSAMSTLAGIQAAENAQVLESP